MIINLDFQILTILIFKSHSYQIWTQTLIHPTTHNNISIKSQLS